MSKPNARTMRRFWLSVAVLSGCVFHTNPIWIPSIPSCQGALTTVNPCGSVFAFCEPSDIDLIFSDIPNYELDPTCTLPGFGFGAPDTDVPTAGCSNQPVYPYTPGPRP